MTCIVAVVDGNAVVMGADSASVFENENSVYIVKHCAKMWRVELERETLLIGFAGSFGQGHYIRYCFKWPPRKLRESYEQWLVKKVMPELQNGLFQRFSKLNPESLDWSLILAIKPGRIFVLSQCGDVFEPSEGFASIGSGSPVAIGAMQALKNFKKPSWEIAEEALEISSFHTTSVRGPMYIEALV